MKHFATIDDRNVRLLCAALIGTAVLSSAAPCDAQVTAAVSASSRYEYDSNIFDLQGGLPVPGTTDFTHADRLYTYGAAVDLNYLWDRQTFFARLADNEFHYDHFSQLDHNEYSLDGGLNWKLLRTLDGTFEFQGSRTLLAFTNTNIAQFDLQTENREIGKLRYAFMPEWRIEGDGYYRTVSQVFLDAPSLDLRETSGTVSLQYLGTAGLTAGLSGAYSDGQYTGTTSAANPSYTQDTYSVTALYAPTGRSSLNGVVGYSERKSTSELNSISGFTGELDYDNQLTGKTTVHVLINRSINSYVATVSSEIDTSAAGFVRWQTTYKLAVSAGYDWMKRNLPGQGPQGILSERRDHLQYEFLTVEYQPARWIVIKPYVNYQTRKSNILGGDYNGSVVGVFFTVKWQNSRDVDPLFQQLNVPAAIR